MAGDDGKQGGGIANNNLILVALVAAAGFAYIREAPLSVVRPVMTEAQLHEKSGRQDIESRLWQDPFEAVAQSNEKASDLAAECLDSTPTVKTTSKSHLHCHSPLFDGKGVPIHGVPLVIGVTVPGGPYFEIAEYRRRLRYAVTSALHTEGFEPEDAQHIGYFVPTLHGDELLPEVIPYEWFEQEGASSDGSRKALILWINEDVLTKKAKPFEALSNLTSYLRAKGSTNQIKFNMMDFRVIGPSSSGTLLSMVSEINNNERNEKDINVQSSKYESNCALEWAFANASCYSGADSYMVEAQSVSFYSYGGTVDDEALLGNIAKYQDVETISLESYFYQKGIKFFRAVASDKVLASAIANELARRDIRPGGSTPQQHLALIYEHDTLYSRKILKSFEDSFVSLSDIDTSYHSGKAVDTRAQTMERSWIHTLAYFRGLDGALPPRNSPAANQKLGSACKQGEQAQDISNVSGPATDSKAFERPFGLGQFDYLRRMAESLKTKDRELRRNGEAGIAAIGILGDDVFDKLLVLRALHPEFRDAVFFTTDYDAALTMPSELEWSRNLVVASSYGPEMNKDIQGDVAEFRTSYQSSIFLATRLAIEDSEALNASAKADRKVTQDQIKEGLTTPRLFEIERSGAVLQLPTAPLHEDGGARSNMSAFAEPQKSKKPSIHPDIYNIFPEISSNARVAGCIVFALIGVCIVIYNRIYASNQERVDISGNDLAQTTTSDKRDNNERSSALGIGLAMTFLMFSIILLFWDSIARAVTLDGLGEPIALIQGISVWPTVLLRIIGTIIAVCLILDAWSALDKNMAQIKRDMNLDLIEDKADGGSEKSWHRKYFDLFRYRIHKKRNNKYDVMDVTPACENYTRLGRAGARFIRIITYTVMVFIVSGLLTSCFGFPQVPWRGNYRQIYWMITDFLAFLSLFLVFLVFDATMLCLRFVEFLGEGSTSWPEPTRERYYTQFNFRDKLIDEWIDLSFIAKRTSCISLLIYYPFSVLALLIISRNTAFAPFSLSIPIIITQTGAFLIVFGCAMTLGFSAEKARETAKKELRKGLVRANAAEQSEIKGSESDKEKVGESAVRQALESGGTKADALGNVTSAQLKNLLLLVEELHEGSFVPLSQQPPVRALLLPITSIGWNTLLDMKLFPGP